MSQFAYHAPKQLRLVWALASCHTAESAPDLFMKPEFSKMILSVRQQYGDVEGVDGSKADIRGNRDFDSHTVSVTLKASQAGDARGTQFVVP